MLKESKEIISVSFLIAGTAIGVGILGLPIQVGLAGILPVCVGILIGVFIMYISGIGLAEAYGQIEEKNVDLPTIAEKTFGKFGKFLVVIAYLIVFWGLLVAYFAAGTSILSNNLPFKMSVWSVLILFFLPLTIMLFAKMKYVLRINASIMILLIVSFSVLLFLSSKDIQFQRYMNIDWSYFNGILPIIICTLAYQNTIPVVCQRLNGDLKKIRLSIIIGLILILMICLLWLLAVIGSLPLNGHHSINSAMKENQPASIPLSIVLKSKWVTITSLFFSIAAIITSYISIVIGMLSFSRDIFSSFSSSQKKIFPVIFTFLPPVTVVIAFPNIFLNALNVVGGIGIVALFGLLPTLILIKQNKNRKSLILGIIAFILFLTIFSFEVVREVGGLKISKDIEYWRNHY